jgi:hypothetical protein
MLITIDLPEGPRRGAEPADGIRDELALVRALLVTLAAERIVGHGRVSLSIDLEAADPGTLVRIAKRLKDLDLGLAPDPKAQAAGGAVIHAFAEATAPGRR